MNGKKLALVLGLVALMIVIPASYVLAHPGGYYDAAEYQYEQSWREIHEQMEDHGDDEVDDDWWAEMREHMEEQWEDIQDENGYKEMEQYGYRGYGGCHRWG